MFDFEDVEPLDYFPGHAPSSPKFRVFTPVYDNFSKDSIFQFDKSYTDFIRNKHELRNDPRYIQISEPINDHILAFMKENLCFYGTEWTFEKLLYVFPEDVAIYDSKENKLITIGLHAPNDWGADLAIGKSFANIHDHIKGHDNKHIIKDPNKMVQAIMNVKGSIERVGGISFASDKRLNRHPSITDRKDRAFDGKNLYMRVERQTMTPFKDLGQFFFTVKTYFYDCADPKYREVITDIFTNPHPNLYAKWYVEKYGKEVLNWLNKL